MALAKINAAEVDRIIREGTETEREQVTALLAAYDEVLEANPLEGFEPYPKQAQFLAAQEPTKAFFGGNRAGKTEIGIVDDLIQAVDVAALPEHLRPYKRWQPPFFCRIVSPDFTATMEGVVFTKLRKLVPKGELKGGSWEKAYDQTRRLLRFRNGSWFQFLTSEQDVDKHSGAALHRVHFDEEPPGEKGLLLYRENRMRLIDYGGQVMITMTPLFGMSWTHDDVWMRRGEPDTFAITASIFDNPHIDRKEVEAAFVGMSEEERQARAEGRFVHFKGLVYGEFEAKHVVPTPDRDHISGQDIVVGIDPGVRWTGIVYVAFDKDNAAVVFDELFLTGATVEDAVREIKAKNREWDIDPGSYVIDPTARNRSLVNAEAVESAYSRAGIWCVHGQNDVEAGVLETKRRLQSTGGLLITGDCQRLLWEIPRYRMDDKADGRFAVVKENDHELDALRYALMSRPWFTGLPKSRRQRGGRGYQPTYSDVEPRWDGAVRKEAPPMGTFS